ncbi:MAG: hypothetical protein V9G98_14995 [Candidatus Competibacter sp.]
MSKVPLLGDVPLLGISF